MPGVCSNGLGNQQCFTDHDCVLVNQYCAPGTPWESFCFRTYDLHDRVDSVADMKVDPQGRVWFAKYIGPLGTIGRLDPASGEVRWFPGGSQHRTRSEFFLGPGGWGLELAPNGDVVFTEFFAGRISRLDVSRIDDPGSPCETLLSGANPCIASFTPPNQCDVNSQGECIERPCQVWFGYCTCEQSGSQCVARRDKSVKALALHPDGTTWFTEVGLGNPEGTEALGIVDAQWEYVVLFPSFSLFDFADASGNFVGFRPSGLTIDAGDGSPESVEIWFTDMFRRQLGRLRKIG
jgi:hypothetical protein